MNIAAIRSTNVENMTEVSPLSGVEKKIDINNSAVKKLEAKENVGLDTDSIKELTEEMNGLMDDLQTTIGFSMYEGLDNQIVIKVTNRETQEVIKQFPSEELLTIKEKMEEFTGLLLDQSV